MSQSNTSRALKDAPALIERLLPVQKLSAEAYKEQMAGSGKTLTALGSYWKGRKPLILNKACILGCLLPATDDQKRDLEIFELLMGMDDASFAARQARRPKPKEILAALDLPNTADFFVSDPPMLLPPSAPVDWSSPELATLKVRWRDDFLEADEWRKLHPAADPSSFVSHPSSLHTRRQVEARLLPAAPYRERVDKAKRPEEVMESGHEHIWDAVNAHLGTHARSFPELVEQLGILRFGHRPRIGDTFCGSGQIPFEAARLGCDVYASDLNPVACLLTWGALNIVGGAASEIEKLKAEQKSIVGFVQKQIDELGVEKDEHGWFIKYCLYCIEAVCPESGWRVPLLPSRVISKKQSIIAVLEPKPESKSYEIIIREAMSRQEMLDAEIGTISRDGKYGEGILTHNSDGKVHRIKISTLRGDYQSPENLKRNRLREWAISDFTPSGDDIFQERLYAIQWMRPKGNRMKTKFDGVKPEDLHRERTVIKFVRDHLPEWQLQGYVPTLRIEPGGPPRYQGLDLIRARGWTYWHHAFTPRQIMVAALVRSKLTALTSSSFTTLLNSNSRLSRWNSSMAKFAETFDNQALNTLYNYSCQSFQYASRFFGDRYNHSPIEGTKLVSCAPAECLRSGIDIYVTDPPYGDAVMYHEITEFFIAWLRKNPPPEFADWVWDSRRALAIKGQDEDFRRNMVAAYKHMTECMPENGLQVIMFTHQSGSIWADMANIVWASGLQVTAAWYVVTETDSALRTGANVKGTVLLVCRKRSGTHKTTRDDLAWEIQEEVEKQIHDLTGLNQQAKGLYRDENVFEDADIQMAGYAAALRVLTRYRTIDGRDMTAEAIRPRVKGETTFVDGLIAFAVDTANQCLVPRGIDERHWKECSGAERFYLKLLDLEAKGLKTIDNFQNFAKAFKVKDFRAMLGSQRANDARLKSAEEFGKAEMGEGSELYQSTLRSVLYALWELQKNLDGTEVLARLALNIPDYYANQSRRDRVVELAAYLASKLESIRPEEASAARVLRDLVRNQRIG